MLHTRQIEESSMEICRTKAAEAQIKLARSSSRPIMCQGQISFDMIVAPYTNICLDFIDSRLSLSPMYRNSQPHHVRKHGSTCFTPAQAAIHPDCFPPHLSTSPGRYGKPPTANAKDRTKRNLRNSSSSVGQLHQNSQVS